MIASNFQSLVHLSLSPIFDESVPLPIDVLEPILSLISLQTLKLVNHRITEIDQVNLVKIFKSLSKLSLLSFRHHQNVTKLPLTTLAAISPVSPKLTNLSLHFNTELDLDDLPDLIVPFPNLRTLDVGRSLVIAPVKVAAFLSRLLPDGCILRFDSETLNRETLNWEKVQELLPAFTQVRKEERRLALASMQLKSV